jgi:poly(hydroxyalkanoate) granule-associated protein
MVKKIDSTASKATKKARSTAQSSMKSAADSAMGFMGNITGGLKEGLKDGHLAGAVKDSAQQIWLAGMGAFSKAQSEGGKVFETLVKEGMSLQRKTQAVAEEKIGEVTGKVSEMASTVTAKAGQNWDKLEGIFEARTAKAMNKLGVPTAKDVDALIKRVDELAAAVAKLSKNGSAKTVAAAPRKAAVKKAVAKTAIKTATKAPAKRASRRASAAA